MAKYRKKPVVIDAEQWFKNGDHSEDRAFVKDPLGKGDLEYPAKVVRRYHDPAAPVGDTPCGHCGDRMGVHGWIDTLEGGHIVCPGDWIITGVKGERYPCKPDIFEATYEPVVDE